MAMAMLRRLATLPLPATFHDSQEVDQIMVLRAAGLLIATSSAPQEQSPVAEDGDCLQVIALTQKGRDELAKFSLPGEGSAAPGASSSWMAKLTSIKNRRPDA